MRKGQKHSPTGRVRMSSSARKRCGEPIPRFWSQTDKEIGEPCWIWTGAKDYEGYGLITVYKRKTKAHRFSWELHNGKIPNGLIVCHHCDNPTCVNPEHLFLGTVGDNALDMCNKDRQASKLTREQVIEILLSPRRGGPTVRQLANKYGVGIGGIEAIRYRVNWKHIVIECEQPTLFD